MNVVVLGAGIFGVTGAVELRRRGHDVWVVDPGPLPHPDAASTDISKAIRMDYGSDALYTELMEQAMQGWDAWNRAWSPPLYHQDGFLLLSPGAMQPGGFEHDSFALMQGRGHVVERLGGSRLAERFPAWKGASYADGYLNPRAGWAESGAVVGRLLEEARDAGVRLVEDGFAAFREQAGRVSGVRLTSGAEISCAVCVVASGAWTPVLLPELHDFMWPVGQPVFHFLPEDPLPFTAPSFSVWAADIGNSGWYGFPALPDGRVKVANHGPGRRVDPRGPRAVAPGDEAMFRTFLRSALPALADAPVVATRLCLYCDTWDGNFLVDALPSRPGVVVASGGSGHAFKFAPLLGSWIADVVDGAPRTDDGRFAWRRPLRRGAEAARFTALPEGTP